MKKLGGSLGSSRINHEREFKSTQLKRRQQNLMEKQKIHALGNKAVVAAGIVFPAPDSSCVLKEGDKVVRLDIEKSRPHPLSVGNYNESVGTVAKITHAMSPYRYIISWSIGGTSEEYSTCLLPYATFLEVMASTNITESTIIQSAKFCINQAVYLKPSIKGPSWEHPSVNSEFETDMKVLGYEVSPLKTHLQYRVQIPNGVGQASFIENQLLNGEERFALKYKDYKKGHVVCDLTPFFSIGEAIRVCNNVVQNLQGTVMVPLTEELKELIILN
jgi:hypothetical protein